MSPHPLRIIHCVRSPVGGTIRHIHDLAIAQAEAGHAVGVVCDSTTGSAFDVAILERMLPHLKLGITRFAIHRHLTIDDIFGAFRLYSSVKSLQPDVLHGHGAKGGAYVRLIGTLLRLQRRNVMRVYCPHGGSLHYDPHRLEGRVYHTLERLQSRLCDGLVFVSDYERAAYESKVGLPRIPARVIYNGLHASEFDPVRPAEDATDFIYIGMLRDLKGPDLFIEAIYNLGLRRNAAVTASIVGEGPDEARYRQMVSDRGLDGQIRFLGALPAREAFTRGRVVVVPSRAEAMPYIVLEAMAAEMPMVATRVGGIPEIFGRHAGRLVEPGDSQRLSLAMADMLDSPDLSRAIARDLRQAMADRFSAGAMSGSITGFYHDLRGTEPHHAEAVPSAPEVAPSLATQPSAKPSYARPSKP
ncbi:glycosyltransferase [Microvirga tunisiensis]|uniref:Glycosyltransferase n=2 Tax=Pannonibacter tanglangensis TaxID=2750084 RepID=A0ABW9ZCW2_9HYPH|nr:MULTISPECIES: glycosyltransferase family 4 protein [unclassified Pannonibacter]NBN62508.1 glycosyltransferase [Pannonibacter sp. XCT-34]NBN78163.1 glycosyltransferase [Pannonibacter sp. XCT-53]